MQCEHHLLVSLFTLTSGAQPAPAGDDPCALYTGAKQAPAVRGPAAGVWHGWTLLHTTAHAA